jgi:acetyl CoA:N6-hydroxylysine acetyl transferase
MNTAFSLLSALPLHDDRSVGTNVTPRAPETKSVLGEVDVNAGIVRVGGSEVARFQWKSQAGDSLTLSAVDLDALGGRSAWSALLVALYSLFAWRPALRLVSLEFDPQTDLAAWLCRAGVAIVSKNSLGNAELCCLRSMLWQHPPLWSTGARSADYPLHYAVSDGKRHPLRPPVPGGTVYRRHVPEIDAVVSLRTIDPREDIDVFHRWMNDPRVARFWELSGDRDHHARYLASILTDPHVHPLIGLFNDAPFGYFEAYWAKEDRIAPFYAVDDYDRGIHMLVGEDRWRGPQRVAAWLPSLVHYLFLADSRTRNVVAEPRADNAKMISYLQRAGFFREKEFDFPHKRAAMMILRRETFFDQIAPAGPTAELHG